jgi:EAL domain-containing protein (putative c-di-GMP-specific phosphodiesterase class I)
VGLVIADIGDIAEQLLSDADSAMYEAKSAGKDCFRLFQESMHARSVERLELTSSLRSALQRGEFFLHYQPHFSLPDGRLEGFEALVRWHHPTLGLVGPDRFIPLAEETGFIVPLGRWVLETACEQAIRWPEQSGPPLSMSVNLSGRQLTDPNLLADVQTALAFSGLPASQLILEITEGALMTDREQTVQVLTALKAIGVRLAVDDFGTGYSSLSYLRQFPVELLKIDKSFVDPLNDASAEGAAFVRSIIRLAHSLGLRTIAEGIEHPDQHRQLTSLGCDSAQGFLLGRPVDGQAASDLVSARQSSDGEANLQSAPLVGQSE